jgi:energy-coupling factor transport system permease protein
MNVGVPFVSDNAWRKSRLHELDARVRLILGLILVILISVILNPVSYLLLSVTLVALAISIKLKWQDFRMLVWPALTMALLTLALHLIFNHSGEKVLTTVWSMRIRTEALTTGLLYSWRVVLFLLAALCLVRLIAPEDFAKGIWRLLSPFGRLKLPVNDIGMAFLIAIRFIPTIFQQYHQILLAQRARGASFGGSLITHVRQITPLLVPITAAAIRKSDTLADALAVRGWGVSPQRTYYDECHLKMQDYLTLAFALVWGGFVVGVGV